VGNVCLQCISLLCPPSDLAFDTDFVYSSSQIMSSETEQQPDSRKRDETLSKDGQWRSFPKVPCLLQYVSNGNYYGRIRVNGKLIRVSLKTSVWTTAKLRLTDLQKDQRENINKVDPPKFSEAVEMFKKELEQRHDPKTTKQKISPLVPRQTSKNMAGTLGAAPQ
jgi:hypothetical protein